MNLTQCYNTDCPQRASCFRFTAPPAEWQSFAHFEPNETTGRCEHYWEVKEVGETKGRTLLEILGPELEGEENVLGEK